MVKINIIESIKYGKSVNYYLCLVNSTGKNPYIKVSFTKNFEHVKVGFDIYNQDYINIFGDKLEKKPVNCSKKND